MEKISVTISEAAEISGLSRATLYRMFGERRITPRKVGRRTLILVDDLRRALENLPEYTGEG